MEAQRDGTCPPPPFPSCPHIHFPGALLETPSLLASPSHPHHPLSPVLGLLCLHGLQHPSCPGWPSQQAFTPPPHCPQEKGQGRRGAAPALRPHELGREAPPTPCPGPPTTKVKAQQETLTRGERYWGCTVTQPRPHPFALLSVSTQPLPPFCLLHPKTPNVTSSCGRGCFNKAAVLELRLKLCVGGMYERAGQAGREGCRGGAGAPLQPLGKPFFSLAPAAMDPVLPPRQWGPVWPLTQ